MAKAPAAKKTTAVVKWDEALAARAKIAQKSVEAIGGGGDWVSFKGGVITFKDQNIGNKLEVIIPSFVLENVCYEGKYDANNPASPLCYAFGTDEELMAPHEACVTAGTAQASSCHECPNNEWESGDGGRGKACKNQIRLAVLPADCLDNGAAGIAEAKEAFAKVPVTSIKAWGSYVNTLGAVGKHPLAVVTEISVAPDATTQFKVSFKAAENIEDGELIGALIDRADALDTSISFAYPKFEAAPERPKRGARSAAAKAAPARGQAAVRPTKGTVAKAAPGARRKF